MKESVATPNYRIRSVERALDILEAFTADEPELGLAAICEKANLPKSTAFKILAVLEERGYVRRGQDDNTYRIGQDDNTYRIGLRAFEVGNRYLSGLTLVGVTRPFLNTLTATFRRCSANLAVLDEGEFVYLDIVENVRPLRYQADIGTRGQVHCAALGKALLAGLSDEELDALLARIEMPKRSPYTITDPQELREHVELVRAQGYAVDDEESEIGTLCVAAPIRDRDGMTVAAISLTGVKAAVAGQVPEMAAQVRQAAEEISRLLGYIPLQERSQL